MKFRSYMLVVLFVLSSVAGNLYAESWNLSVDASLTLTQNTYSDNRAGGEGGRYPGCSIQTHLQRGNLARRSAVKTR